MRKALIKCFKEEGLSITVECNIRKTDFLDVILDLENKCYRPYRKPNDTPLYININSNHPDIIKKQLPKMIEKRLSTLSSSEEIFQSAVQPYETALRESGYKAQLTYVPEKNEKVKKRKRQRKIIWFNPPFNSTVRTNVGKKFLNLVVKHFSRHPILKKVFNRNTVKVSYCNPKNMKAKIDKHNRKILEPVIEESENTCSCPKKNKPNCPLQGNCLVKSIVYQADVKAPNKTTMTYYGLTEMTFKERYYGHTSSLRHEKNKNETELSKYVWKLRNEGISPSIKWSIKAKAYTYQGGATHCDLCLTEKTIITLASTKTTLNSRTEIFSKCRHQRKFTLQET